MGKRKGNMSAYRCLILTTSLLLLSGCDALKDNDQLRNELKTSQDSNTKLTLDKNNLELKNSNLTSKIEILSSRINNDYTTKIAELEKQERDAAITQACTQPFNINVCPKSMTKPGENAIKNGISGGSNPIFWIVYSLKWLSLILITFPPLLILSKLWYRQFKPKLKEIYNMNDVLISQKKELQEILETKKNEIQKVYEINDIGNKRGKELNSRFSDAEDELNTLLEQIQTERNNLAAIEKKDKSMETAIGALRAFEL
jgi:hypothetical protein